MLLMVVAKLTGLLKGKRTNKNELALQLWKLSRLINITAPSIFWTKRVYLTPVLVVILSLLFFWPIQSTFEGLTIQTN